MSTSIKNGKKRTLHMEQDHTVPKKQKIAPAKVLRNDALADQLKQMFASEGLVDKPANCFKTISNLLFDRIMKSVSEETNYRPMYETYLATYKKKGHRQPMDFTTFYLKKFYQLQFVDKRFAGYFERRIKDLPKVPIGVRIQPKLEKAKQDPDDPDKNEGKVVYSIHHGAGIIAPNVCDFLQNIHEVLKFGQVTPHLVVFGLPLDDNLISALRKIDRSQVEKALFYNIPYVHFDGDVKQKARELVSLFPKAELIDFNGPGFDYEVMFGDATDYSDLIRHDVQLSGAQMAHRCLQQFSCSKTNRRRTKARRAKELLIEIAAELDAHSPTNSSDEDTSDMDE